MQEVQDSAEQTSTSGILYECDCHCGLSNVNPQNMMGYCLELWYLKSIYLTCPAASTCPVYTRLAAALTYAANVKFSGSLHLQNQAPPCSAHILRKMPRVENGQNQHYGEFSSVLVCLNPTTLHFSDQKGMNWNLAWERLILHEFKLCEEVQRFLLWADIMRLQQIVQSQPPYGAIHMQRLPSLTEGWLTLSAVILSSLY